MAHEENAAVVAALYGYMGREYTFSFKELIMSHINKLECIPISEIRDAFVPIWQNVRKQYEEGFCASERNLQAILFMHLSQQFKHENIRIIVEPQWEIGEDRAIPDIVMVENDDVITDVFEIKYAPHAYPRIDRDIEKLFNYSNMSRRFFPVRIVPGNGKWVGKHPSISQNLRTHFVAIGKHDSAAVCPESLFKRLPPTNDKCSTLFHWFGQACAESDKESLWGIALGKSDIKHISAENG